MSDTAESFPEGWQLGCESWRFHRQFYARLGRVAEHGEYSAIRGQIRFHVAESLGARYYRVRLSDGTSIVIHGGWHRLSGVEPADWMPRSKIPEPSQALPAADLPVAHQSEVPPPPRQPLRASTLTLGNPGAARLLAERLRRFGLPEHAISQPAPP